ncbi:dTDP-4-dehydrorhamnose reductase [Paraferrimonas sp. SM1919]|uniref:dTDP-4-dehydrorhamnose reductase n=1 Tax=Paraferrimonas sp. SM1919 TaxID=2662263 RepID=UPI0013D3695F|nr:dTDP-4-dehydrorhamnose reductase [Paraferrimonas sp. SM1919]
MKILVTGANGQVGYSLLKQLKLETNIELLSADRNTLDITNKQAVDKIVNEFKPDFIINAAAHTGVDKAESEPELAHAINALGPQYLAEAAEAINATMLHISTDYVFDGGSNKPYIETDTPNPQGVYGKSKLAGEQAVINACSKHIILRTAWVFCEHGNNFVKTMLKLGAIKDELGIIGDQFGGPTYAGDIAAALIRIAKQVDSSGICPSGIYHFSGAPHVSWYQFAVAIFVAADNHAVLDTVPKVNEIPATAYPLPAPRPANSRLNCDKINTEFNIAPSNWQAALQNIKAYAAN